MAPHSLIVIPAKAGMTMEVATGMRRHHWDLV
jgi:hypothetical protein